MNFNDFDKEMRVYEQSLDQKVLPDMYMVARLDGHGFSKMTARKGYKKPFDEQFRNLMVEVTEDLMKNSNLNIIYGYTESDEISLLFSISEESYARKTRKLNSLLAAQASARASLILKEPVTFDCRVVPLPSKERVLDYFAWRQEDSARNALNGYCYWTARQEVGLSQYGATSLLKGRSAQWMHDYLYQHGIIYGDGDALWMFHIPAWQKRGVGIYWAYYGKKGVNPKTGKEVIVKRRKCFEEYVLPMKDEYRKFLMSIITQDEWKSKKELQM